MIPASEALALPTAQLSDEEKAAADKLEAVIEAHIRKTMKFQGCLFQTKEETNESVAVIVGHRFKAAGYLVQWNPIVEQNKFNASVRTLVGWQFAFMPTDEIYREAAHANLS
jgi:hypothetical protein